MGTDPRMKLTLKDMPKWPTPEKRLPLCGDMRNHHADGTYTRRWNEKGEYFVDGKNDDA